MSLHRLPIAFRIDFNILPVTDKAVHSQTHSYIEDLLERCHPRRLANEGLQVILKKKKKQLGGRTFSFLVPLLWDHLSATGEGHNDGNRTVLFVESGNHHSFHTALDR